MKVVFCSPLLSYPGHFRRLTIVKAGAFASAGMNVTVIGFPALERTVFAPAVDYVGVVGRLGARGKSLIDRCRRLLGKLWVVVFENIAVYCYALKYAKAAGADIVFVNDVEAWIVVLLNWFGRLRRAPPMAGFVPSGFFIPPGMRVPVFVRLRAWLIHKTMPALPRLIRVICDSATSAKLLFPAATSTVSVVPEGFDAPNDSPLAAEEARRRLDLPAGKRILLLFGMDIPARGADLLYEALRGLEPAFMLCVVGKIARLYAPFKKGADNGWESNVRKVERYVSEEERWLYFNACDAVILPFRHGFTTTSQCLRDAISCGKAVLACDQYVVGETVKENHIGLVFPPGDVDAMRRCLKEFAAQPRQWFDRIAVNGRGIAARYCWENVGRLYRNVFESIDIARKN